MAYRDELEAAQARIRALEQELADARGAKPSQALVKAGRTALARTESDAPAARKWLGAPTMLVFTREVDGEIPKEAHTELVEHMRRTLNNVGAATVLPGSLAWTSMAQHNGIGPHVNVYVTYRDGKTTIRAEQKLGNLAGGIFGGVGGGVGGGGIMAPIALAWINPILVPVGLAVWLGGTYAACRKLYTRSARKHARTLETLADSLARIAEKYIERSTREAG